MKEGTEKYRCAECGKEFVHTFPVAETRDEYIASRTRLAGGYVVDGGRKARRRVACPIPECRGRVTVTILDQAS